MAYVGRQVEVAREGDVAVGRVVDHVVDPRTGFVAERERVAVQVPTEDGGTAVVMGERIRAVRVVSTPLYLSTYLYIICSFSFMITIQPTWIQSNCKQSKFITPFSHCNINLSILSKNKCCSLFTNQKKSGGYKRWYCSMIGS